MKRETVSRLNYESIDCKYAYVWKWKLQVGLVMKVKIASMKVEIASMLNNENRKK